MFEGQRIAYTEYPPEPPGEAAVTPIGSATRKRAARAAKGPTAHERTLILVHGLLLAQTMHMPLARALAARGNRVITIDLLGHGESDRPRDMWRSSAPW
jgi:pimeloyl-ACP methyl ester carboxylesterase